MHVYVYAKLVYHHAQQARKQKTAKVVYCVVAHRIRTEAKGFR
jgi:hypothetical protein